MDSSRPDDDPPDPVQEILALEGELQARRLHAAVIVEGERFTAALAAFLPGTPPGPVSVISVDGAHAVLVRSDAGTPGHVRRSRDLVRGLATAGIGRILVLADAESLDDDPGRVDVEVVGDHVNLWADNPLTGPNDDTVGPRFPDMSEVYDPGLRDALAIAVGAVEPIVLASAPDPEEITRNPDAALWHGLGVDAVTRGVVPGAVTARHAGLDVACLAALRTVEPSRTAAVLRVMVHAS